MSDSASSATRPSGSESHERSSGSNDRDIASSGIQSMSDQAVGIHRRNSGSSEPTSPEKVFNPVIKEGHQDEMDDEKVNLDAIKKILLEGDEDELLIALFETQQIIKNCREFAIQSLVPVICEKVTDWSHSIKLSAAEALLAVMDTEIPHSLTKTIGKTAYRVLNFPFDQPMCHIWGDVLVATIPIIAVNFWSAARRVEVIDELEGKYAASGNPLDRQLAARVLGSLATCSKGDELRRLMSSAVLITADKDPQVRGMIAESLASIGASTTTTVVEQVVWPCLSKLLSDKDARVHAASIRSLSKISATHRKTSPKAKLFAQLLPSVFMQECSAVRRDAQEDLRRIKDDLYLLLEINAQVFGEFLYSCYDHLSDDMSKKEAFKAFLAMCTCNGPVIRKHCAYNMPAVAFCFNKTFGPRLAAIVEFLSRDAYVETRWMLAAGMHETVKVLTKNDTRENLFRAVYELIKDSEPLVRSAALEHFEQLIVELAKHFGYSSAEKLTPLFQNLRVLAKGQWRTQELLARQLQLAVPLIPPPYLKMDVLPMLYLMAEGSASQVRKAAMEAIAICIRYIPDQSDRCKSMKTFNVGWAKGSVYWMRISYIDAAETAVSVYSRCLFRDTYGQTLLQLAQDTVANVRLRVALIIPRIAPSCNQMEGFEAMVEKLKEDTDKDVLDAMRNIDTKIARALDKGRESFEDDMRLEAEEQKLYSRHLYAQRDAQKVRNAMKRRPGALLGKAAKGLHPSSQKRGSHQLLDDSAVPSAPSGSEGGFQAVKPRRSQSFSAQSTSGLENVHPNVRLHALPSKNERQSKNLASLKPSSSVSSAHGEQPGSPSGSNTRSHRGLKQLMSPKHSANNRKGGRPKKTLA